MCIGLGGVTQLSIEQLSWALNMALTGSRLYTHNATASLPEVSRRRPPLVLLPPSPPPPLTTAARMGQGTRMGTW